jgi:predicted lipoprotein
MKKWLKYIVLIAVTGLLAYNSVYFKKLDAKKEVVETNLNPAAFAQKFWAEKFIPACIYAVEINSFTKMLKENPEKVFKEYAYTTRIGGSSYFLVKGEGNIISVNEDNVIVTAKFGTDITEVQLNTGIYFGNAVRDVTGKISMGDFKNTMDFNNVSTELNKIVRTQVILPFKINAAKGKTVQFVGCAEINKEQINITDIQVLPVRININK